MRTVSTCACSGHLCRWAKEKLKAELYVLQKKWVTHAECVGTEAGTNATLDDAATDEDLPEAQLKVADMAFLYLVWGIVALVLMGWRIGQVIYARHEVGVRLLPWDQGVVVALFGDAPVKNTDGLYRPQKVDTPYSEDELMLSMAQRINSLQSDFGVLQKMARRSKTDKADDTMAA